MEKMMLAEWDLGIRGPEIMIFNISNSLTSKKVGSMRAEMFCRWVEWVDVGTGGWTGGWMGGRIDDRWQVDGYTDARMRGWVDLCRKEGRRGRTIQ